MNGLTKGFPLPDFTTYQPPGVYVEEDLSSLVNVIGVRPTVVALVGPAVGYRTYTEALVLTGTVPVQVSNRGVDPTSVVVTAADGSAYDSTTDYAVAVAAGTDGNIATTGDNTLTIARLADSTIPAGGMVYATYRYTDTEYHAPLRVQDFDDVQDAFGPPLDIETGEIISPLSFAAKVAIENGARNLILVPTTGGSQTATRAELSAAYNKLKGMPDVNVVVPLAAGITGTQAEPGDVLSVATDLRTHVETQAQDGQFRVGIVGFESTATLDPVQAIDAFRSSRVVFAWPNRLFYYHGYRNVTVEVAGYYLAAAYAGRLASLPVQMPLTKKEIVGFTGFPSAITQQMTNSVKNSWSDAGIAVTEQNRAGRLVVRHGTTTNRTNVQTRELSLVRAKDALINLLYETVDSSSLVGGYIDETTPTAVLGVITGVLESAKNSDVIVDYTGLKIRQLTTDPSVMEVKFQYRPAYPLNYVVISFSIDTTTGATNVVDAAA